MIDDLPQGSEMILVVDDHETIWDFLIDALQMLGYTVLLAENGLDAVSIYEENPGMIDLVLLDMIMPKAGGHETFIKLKAIDPNVKVLLSSGFVNENAVEDLLSQGACGFLPKPHRLPVVAKAIREVLDLPCDNNALADLKQRIEQAGKIVYILDNCGEAVLDRLLLETMKDKVTIAVRGKAIMNDITRREIAASNLADFPLIDTGSNAPGAPLKLVSPEFRRTLESADLVIAKGQGNFESLEEDFISKPIYFLLRAKCPVIQNYLGVDYGSLQLIGKNLDTSRT